jgi:hypothetical protein
VEIVGCSPAKIVSGPFAEFGLSPNASALLFGADRK